MNALRILLVSSLVLSAAAPASATLDNVKTFKQAYPGKDAKAYSCAVCHQGLPVPKGKLTTYGDALKALKGAGNAKKLTVEDFRAVEKEDADKDGFSNGDELNAGTSASDAKSVPAAKAVPAKKQ